MSTRCRLAATNLFYAASGGERASFAWRLTVAPRRYAPSAPVRLRKAIPLKAHGPKPIAYSRSSNEAKNID